MQFSTIAVVLSSLLAVKVAASPTGTNPPTTCTFGVYRCASYFNGIEQCGAVEGGLDWRKIGECPYGTHCGNIGAIPYCLTN